jgi:hypothetical protein
VLDLIFCFIVILQKIDLFFYVLDLRLETDNVFLIRFLCPDFIQVIVVCFPFNPHKEVLFLGIHHGLEFCLHNLIDLSDLVIQIVEVFLINCLP